jgi:molecular chaperone GrpE
LESKNQELNDRLLRRLAEFENYKKRTEQDQLNILKYAAEPFIVKILSIYDDLERSLSHIDEENRQSLVDGLKMIHDKFTKILSEQGVEKLKAKGEEFDFNIHEALMRQPSKDLPANTVIEEIEPGYIYKDKVIKHAKVIVTEELADEESGKDSSQPVLMSN